MSSKEDKKAEAEAEAAQMTGTEPATKGPEASGQQNAATLEEAMALQDKLAREANGTTEEPEAEAAPTEE